LLFVIFYSPAARIKRGEAIEIHFSATRTHFVIGEWEWEWDERGLAGPQGGGIN